MSGVQGFVLGLFVSVAVFVFRHKLAFERLYQRGVSFGLQEGVSAGFSQGVILAIKNLKAELKSIGVVMDPEISITDGTRPGLYKLVAFCEITMPGQEDVAPAPETPDNVHQLKPKGDA